MLLLFRKKKPQTQGGENLGLDQCKVFTSLIAEMFEWNEFTYFETYKLPKTNHFHKISE